MTAFFKGKAVSQIDEVLIEGVKYTEKEIKKIMKENNGNNK